MDDFDPATNPFAAPLASDTAPPPEGEAADNEAIRREYLKHEASIRSIGVLYFLGAVFTGIASVMMIGVALGTPANPNDPPAWFFGLLAFIYLLLTFFMVWCGRGLRQLDRRVRIPTMIYSAIGLIAIPFGTIINGYILYLLGSAKGNFILTPEYQRIRAATPHIRYRSSLGVLLLVGLLVVVFILVMAAWVTG